jgi:hypothetical protein
MRAEAVSSSEMQADVYQKHGFTSQRIVLFLRIESAPGTGIIG